MTETSIIIGQNKSHKSTSRHFIPAKPLLPKLAYLLNEKLGAKGIAVLMKMIENSSVRIDFSIIQHTERIATLTKRYENVPMDYADACVVVMAEQEKYREHMIVTVDDTDFSIYRRNGREALTINTPQR